MLAATITTVTGLLPLIFSSSGSNLWQGFAITLTAGLCGSLLFLPVLTPLLFDLYQKNFSIYNTESLLIYYDTMALINISNL